MTATLATAFYFTAYLATVTGTHAMWNRLWPQAGAPQGRALLTVLGVAAVYLGAAIIWARQCGSDWTWVPYLGICLLCLAYCYWSLICLSESGRRYRIAYLVHSGEARNVDEILRLYNRNVVVDERLARLMQWNEISFDGGRYRSRGGRMSKASAAVHAWARLLGFVWFEPRG